jgi:phosphohistidine phosphatase
MKTLYVLRHAKSDWGDESLRDFDRPLNERGRKAAKAMGREMHERGIEPDLVLSSPAVRAKQTLERVQEGFGQDFEAVEDRRIYAAQPNTLIDLVRSAPAGANRLMVVGHNPGLQQLVLALTEDGDLRDEAAEKYPTAALAEISFDVREWADVAPGTGRLASLLRPRDL